VSHKRFSYESTGFVRAQARWVRSSPQKARVVLAHIRGKSVLEARALLLYSKRDVAKDIELVLRSAVANAEANHGLSPDELVIHEAFADEGVTIKRWKPRARGRANRIQKKTTHITLLLRAVEGLAVAPAPAPEPEVVEEKPKRRRKAAAATPADEAVTAASTDEPAEGATEPGEGEDVGPVSTDAPAEGPDDESADPEAVVAVDDEVEAVEDVAEDEGAVAAAEPAADEDDDEAAEAAADDEKGKD
jgi:large subunit ribosomal protein L22